MKYIVIVPDGMADHPIEELNNRTPLEVADTPHMDMMAENGIIGQVQTIPDGLYPGSDIGNMAILGYDPKTYHTGRAPIEAANQNITLQDNEVAFRCNLVTVENDKLADYSAGHISTKESSILIDTLNKELGSSDLRFVTGKGYRHLLILKTHNPKDYCKIKTHAPHDILNKEIKKHLPSGKESELLLKLMERSKQILADHPINQVRIDLKENPAHMIWLWGQGTKPKLPPFADKQGVNGAIISAVDIINGIGRLAGLEIIDVQGATGYYDTNYLGKGEAAIKSLKKNDFVYVHIEAPDEAGHNGDMKEKITAIENIDKYIVGPILKHFKGRDDVRIVLLPDHPTPIKLRTHTAEPVGFVMYGNGIEHSGTKLFNEKTAAEKGLIFKSGEALMNYFIRLEK